MGWLISTTPTLICRYLIIYGSRQAVMTESRQMSVKTAPVLLMLTTPCANSVQLEFHGERTWRTCHRLVGWVANPESIVRSTIHSLITAMSPTISTNSEI